MRYKRTMLRKKITTFLLLYFMFFTLYLTANTLSKYTGKTRIDGAKIDIAKWDVSTETSVTTSNLSLVAGNTTQEYKVVVTSASEVACKYSIVITNIPNDIIVSIDDGELQVPVENKITFSDVGSFTADNLNSTHEHTLKFEAPIEASSVENIEMQLDIIFVQDEI